MKLAASRWVLGLALVTAMMTGCKKDEGRASAKPGRTQPISILQQVHGNDPALRDAERFLFNSTEQINTVGAAELAKINVDFDKQSLIVLASGERPTGGYWVHITGVQRQGDKLFIQGTANRPAADQQVAQAMSYPFAAVVVPKVEEIKQIVPEVESVTGHPLPTEEGGATEMSTTDQIAPAETQPAGETGTMQ
jgi:hypothetical protein